MIKIFPHEIFVLFELILGHLCYHLADYKKDKDISIFIYQNDKSLTHNKKVQFELSILFTYI
jgi:hypothetical protein